MKFQEVLAGALCVLAVSNVSLADETNGKELFNKHCISCHVTSGQPTVAPPIFGVINHVKNAHPNKTEFVDTIAEWVVNPQADKVLMPGAVRRFGIMPKLPIEPTEVRLIAEYLYDGKTELPAWYIEHYKAEHGSAPQQ